MSSESLSGYIYEVFGGPTLEKDAQVVFVREDLESLHESLVQFPEESIKVLFASELTGLNLDFFDYVIGWETSVVSDRYFRLPPAIRERWFFDNPLPIETLPMGERRFCNYIYSNPKAHPFRDEFFQALNSKMAVDSLGKHLNNSPIPESIQKTNLHWGHQKILLQSRYKFSLAFENGIYDGYTTEKLITASLAGSIPIYWGNPHVSLDFNPKRFVSLHDFVSAEKAIEFIIELSNDENRLREMVAQPLLTEDQSSELVANEAKLLDFLRKIKASASSGQSSRPRGTTAAESKRLFLEMYKYRNRVRVIKSILGRHFRR